MTLLFLFVRVCLSESVRALTSESVCTSLGCGLTSRASFSGSAHPKLWGGTRALECARGLGCHAATGLLEPGGHGHGKNSLSLFVIVCRFGSMLCISSASHGEPDRSESLNHELDKAADRRQRYFLATPSESAFADENASVDLRRGHRLGSGPTHHWNRHSRNPGE